MGLFTLHSQQCYSIVKINKFWYAYNIGSVFENAISYFPKLDKG